MAEDVGVAISIGLDTSHIRHSVGRQCPTLDSTKVLRAAYAHIMVCPRKRTRYRLREPMSTLTSYTLPGVFVCLCDARKPYPLGAR
jgi:hypothetical protein